MENKPVRWDEETLVSGCLKNKAAAQKALYEQYSARMMGICYRYAQNRFDAQDILQEGFLKVFVYLRQYNFSGSLEGWIRKIMVRTAINFLKKNKQFQQNMEADKVVELSSCRPEHALHNKDILEMIAALPAGCRVVLNLYAIEGYAHKEIAELLDIAESTSRSQYARAKAMLAQRMKEGNIIDVKFKS